MSQWAESALLVLTTRSPIQRLTDDALLDIFAELAVAHEEVDERSVFCIASVCRRWRELIHGSSLFWSYIRLATDEHRNVDLRARYWLNRARERPLVICIELASSWSYENTIDKRAQLVRLAQALRDSTDRWESLSICGHPFYIEIFLQHCSGATHMLTSLRIELGYALASTATSMSHAPKFQNLRHLLAWRFLTSDFGWIETSLPTDRNMDVLRSCPNLTKLRLLYCHVEEVATFLALLQLSALKHFSVSQIRWTHTVSNALMRVFQTCPCLEYIELNRSGFRCQRGDKSPTPTIPLITLPSVTTFDVNGDPSFAPYQRRLLLPNIERLHLQSTTFDVAFHLMSNAGGLTSLFLDNITEQPHTYAYQLFPKLISLNTAISSEFLDAIWAPKLSSLAIARRAGNTVLFRVSPRRLLEGSAPPLAFLHLHYVEIADSDFVWCLERLPCLQGLTLRYCSTSDVALHELATFSSDPTTPILPQLECLKLISNENVTAFGVIAHG
ncbi:hypothetical protein BOTBODRAFT_170740 [Botryobasidium botryosum FD-172 SS1]|uniref:F-box domain-containing protein n=1 Tax=Botryobasidium botryosum (strain FD-172 SS1) TaxID=930990 RepID=A0A067N7C0_BOTB1|nr:hypothetical protein BOTBODRAFT_170740 [Botryobasidium botryosum FD-172 SS1]